MPLSNLCDCLAILTRVGAQIKIHTDVLKRLVDRVLLGQHVTDRLQNSFAEIFSKTYTNHCLCDRRMFVSFRYRCWRLGCCHCYVFVDLFVNNLTADLLQRRSLTAKDGDQRLGR